VGVASWLGDMLEVPSALLRDEDSCGVTQVTDGSFIALRPGNLERPLCLKPGGIQTKPFTIILWKSNPMKAVDCLASPKVGTGSCVLISGHSRVNRPPRWGGIDFDRHFQKIEKKWEPLLLSHDKCPFSRGLRCPEPHRDMVNISAGPNVWGTKKYPF